MYAYILVSFKPGFERDAFDTLSINNKVKDINMIFGEWDIITKVQVDSPADLEAFIIDTIRKLEGVRLTSSLIVAK